MGWSNLSRETKYSEARTGTRENSFSFFPSHLTTSRVGSHTGRLIPNNLRNVTIIHANADRNIFIFPLQLTTCRIGNLTQLIDTFAICATIYTYKHTYIHTYIQDASDQRFS